MQRCRHVVSVTLKVVVESVGRHDDVVVVSESYPRTWCLSGHLCVVRVQLLHLLLGVLAEEVVVCVTVCEGGVHGYDGVEEYLEVGQRVALGVCRYGRGEVTACRRAHDAYILGVDIPALGVPPDHSHGLLSVLNGHFVIAVGQTVVEHYGGYALLCEEWRPVCTLTVHDDTAVCATGTDDHCTACRTALLWQEDLYVSLILRVAIVVRRLSCPEADTLALLVCRAE